MVMRPMVAAVAADEPEMAAKMPQPTTLVCIRRPGSGSTHGARPRNMSSEMRVRKRISPIQMKSGRAVSAQLALEPHTVVAMTRPAGELVNASIATSATASSVMPIHTPSTRQAPSVATRTSETSQRSMGQRSNAAPSSRACGTA